MSLVILPYIFSSGTTIIASQTNANNTSFLNAINGGLDNTNLTGTAGITYANLSLGGNIVNSDISSSAAIANSKLANITTAGMVSGAALTSLSSIPSGAGIIPIANLPSLNFGFNNIQVFLASGTWTQPAGITSAYVKIWGAGGGSGHGDGATFYGGAGGGAGYIEGIVAVSGNVAVTIGAGGTGGTGVSGTITATAGGLSSFAGTVTFTANGGNPGTDANNGASAGADGTGGTASGTGNSYEKTGGSGGSTGGGIVNDIMALKATYSSLGIGGARQTTIANGNVGNGGLAIVMY